MYVTAERYTEDGKFIKRIRIDNVDLSNKNTQINIPEFINCQDGSYVVISCYERWVISNYWRGM